jgi:isoleucyl-tRNA synthetase
LRNTFRWALGNLEGFDPFTDSVPPSEMLEIDRWILVRAEELVLNCRGWYGEYLFHRVYQAVYNFATTDLSAIYFDITKDRLYTAAPRSIARRAAQTALWRITYALSRLLAPILAFTTEEVWSFFARPAGAPGSVHLALLPEPTELAEEFDDRTRARLGNWPRLLEARDLVMKSLEAAREAKFIGASLQAAIRLQAGSDWHPLLSEYVQDLPALFIVSDVFLEKAAQDGLAVHVERTPGVKCERCWKFTTDVGSHPDLPSVCAACAEAVLEISQTAVV